MIILIVGLLLFVGVHLLRELKLRDALIEKLGAGPYRGLYSMVAVAGLGLIIWGKSQSGFVQIYQPIYELKEISHIAMLPAMILVTAGNLPMSILRRHTLHPMLIGTAIWGGAHLWANGDLASVLLFGSLLLWSVIKFVSLSVAKPPGDKRPALIYDVVAVIVGSALYGLITIYHGQLFGIGLTLV